MITQSQWESRRNYILFDETYEVSQEDQQVLDMCLQSTPIQDDGTFKILKLHRNKDKKVLEFLTHRYFLTPNAFHMIPPSTASIVYLVMHNTEVEQWPDKYQSYPDLEHFRTSYMFQIGIHAGALMAAAVEQNLDFAFIGCSDAQADENIDEWKAICKQENIPLSGNDRMVWPIVALCVGKKKDPQPFEGIHEHYLETRGATVRYFGLQKREHVSKKQILLDRSK